MSAHLLVACPVVTAYRSTRQYLLMIIYGKRCCNAVVDSSSMADSSKRVAGGRTRDANLRCTGFHCCCPRCPFHKVSNWGFQLAVHVPLKKLKSERHFRG